MNVFVLCTGRSGSVTFRKACSHITNFSSGHETRTDRIGEERLNYPDQHIEVDNRLSWFLGRLDAKYGNNAIYIHLMRNRTDTAKSFENRYNQGIMNAYKNTLINQAGKIFSANNVCQDYVNTVEENIKLFLKDKVKKMEFHVENVDADTRQFWKLIGAKGNIDAAIKEWQNKNNSSRQLKMKGTKELKRAVKIKILISGILRKNRTLWHLYKIYKFNPHPDSIQGKLRTYSRNNRVKFIQVGGNDGQSNDPLNLLIYKYKWEGVILEPQKNVFFKQLKKTYESGKRIKLVNAAIDSIDRDRKLYKISFSEKRWATGLSTFIEDKLRNNVSSGYVERCAKKHGDHLPVSKDNFIMEENVQCISFKTLLLKYKITNLDVLAIDTEGYDFEIIKMFDFSIIKPKYILYEHSVMSSEDKFNCENFLYKKGYSLIKEINNTLAYIDS